MVVVGVVEMMCVDMVAFIPRSGSEKDMLHKEPAVAALINVNAGV
jgi:hypothetical protein